MIDITLPFRTPTLNQLLRMHWSQRRKEMKKLAWEIRRLAGPAPAQPYARARVTIYRTTPAQLDPDGVKAIAKGILDVLQPCCLKPARPLGLGWIASDGPAHLELIIHTIKSRAATTRIVIEAL